MSTKEPRKRPSAQEEETTNSKQSNESVEDWLDNINVAGKSRSSIETLDLSSTQESEKSAQQIDLLLAEFVRQLPSWVNKPWMYVKPTHDGHLINWLESWKQLILKYTTIFTKHIIVVYDLQHIHPFNNSTSGKNLSFDELTALINHMVEENLAKWLDNDNKRARIYFRTDSEWAEILYQFTLDQGYATDIMTLYELQNLHQPWSSLPDDELRLVLQILVEQQKAEWIGKEKDTVQFKI